LHLKSAGLAKLPQQKGSYVTLAGAHPILRGLGRRTENTISICFALRPGRPCPFALMQKDQKIKAALHFLENYGFG
jgi:hypothetical protein